MDIFKGLISKRLKEASKDNDVGCPFSMTYGGKVDWHRFPRRILKDQCKVLCGRLFPKTFSNNHCPCQMMHKSYVKRRFWKKFNESRR